MSTRRNGVSGGQKSKTSQVEGPNWILIAGGAFLSTLSIRLAYKLKQALDSKQQAKVTAGFKGNGTCDRRSSPDCHLHSNMCPCARDDDGCFNCIPGAEGSVGIKHPSDGHMASGSDVNLPVVTVPAPEFDNENGVTWSSSPDRLEFHPPRTSYQSTFSDSPCVSESGSDIFSRREVIQKLRQQVKGRDDMILEMQDRILELQNSLDAQMSQSNHLQAQIDAANRDLFVSEREIQRLRKAIADHCVGHAADGNTIDGHANGYVDGESIYESWSEKEGGDGERIERLKREIGELKKVIEGNEYLLQKYKEQKVELSSKMKELQQRLDSQLPNIL